MKLTPEQIAELLAEHTKPNQYGNYTPSSFEPPKQVGPMRLLAGPSKPCVHRGHYKDGEHVDNMIVCGAPAYVSVDNKRYCLLHAAMVLNLRLHKLEVHSE